MTRSMNRRRSPGDAAGLLPFTRPNLAAAPLAVVLLALLLAITPSASAQFTFDDINPNSSTLDPSDPDGATGGRVNGLATVAGDNDTFYAASEWGGIYKSTNGGVAWSRLDGHNPTVTWDVEVDPSDSSKVYATSFFDGRVTSLAGINVSSNAGTTWSHATVPNTGGICSTGRFNEPSAFGIAIDADDPDDVYVGTNCGLAVSTNAGATWTRIEVDQTPDGVDTDVWDVIVHHGGIIDACGDNGHLRSTDGGATWDASAGLPGGVCSLAVSPEEADTLFVTFGTNIYESADGGDNWTNLGTPDSSRQGRITFVAVNDRSGDAFDLWFGDVRLYRGGCTINPAAGTTHCPQASLAQDPPDTPPAGWAGPFTRGTGGHDDLAAIAFDSEAANDACPEIYSCDGGVYYNTDTTSPGCHDPNWEQPTTTPHGLWLWALAGFNKAGAGTEDLYFGNQDNGTFGATDGGSASVTWKNADCCDGFDFAPDADDALYTVCCGSPRANKMYRGNPGLTSAPEINTYPADGLLRGFRPPDIVDTYGANQFVVLTRNCTPSGPNAEGGCSGANGGDGGMYITNDVTASPIVWTELGNPTEPVTGVPGMCGVKAAVSGGSPTFWVQVGNCDGASADQLWRFDGTNPAGTWTNETPAGGIGVFDVDPNDPERLLASILTNPPQMVMSTNGGATWDSLPELDALMTGNGDYSYVNSRGPTSFTGLNGYPQPSLVAFDAEDPTIMAAGGRDSGVFLSTDGGSDWVLITDPDSTGGSVPHLPSPYFAYFDHEGSPDGAISMYVGTRGRGVWRVSFDQPPIADAGGPYTTNEGANVQLDGRASYDPSPGGSIVSYEWDFDDDGLFDDAVGEQPFFDPIGDGVGQDGVYIVRLKVTDNDGLTDTDESTVTVNNVAPSVTPASDSPKDENTTITVTATITDPGWLDVLTATINWGDGSATEPMALTGSENLRPDATYTFSATHIYGDNGAFTAQVCGYDDDTSTCANINLTILNVNPTVEIDETDIVDGCGEDAFIAHAGDDVTFTGHATDPGSDDLDLTWNWGDGTPDTTTTYLVNPPLADPFPSPSIQPRDVTDVQVHAFADACLYEVTFSGLDDDGGTDSDSTDVVIVGNATLIRSAGYWYHQYRSNGRIFFTAEELQCYLDIVNHLSALFSEAVDADSRPDARAVLDPSHSTGDIRVQLDRQLLALWLNFANGAIDYDTLVDTDFDNVPDTALLDVLCDAEADRLNPATPDSVLESWKNIVESVNLSDQT
jgi:hypothetical protein